MTYERRYTLSEREQWIAAIALKPGCCLSIIVSICVIYHIIFRAKGKLTRLYHRIILGMYIFCVIESIFKFLGQWPMKKGTMNAIGASGTVGSCEFQGAMITLGHAVLVYYASLSIYAYLSIENDFNVDALKQREWMIHVAAILIPMLPTIFAIAKNLYNPKAFVCTVVNGYDPPDCLHQNVSECQVRGTEYDQNIIFFLFLPFYLCLIFSTLITVLLVYKQVAHREKAEQYLGKRRYIHEFRMKKAVVVTKQALLYLFACYLSYGVDQTVAALDYFEVHVPFAWHVIGEVLFSFHGVIIAVVHIIASGDAVEFLGIKVGRSLSMIEIQVNKDKPYTQSDGTNAVSKNSHVNTMRRSVAFPIFQELTEEEKWKRFGVYVGSEDDDDDSRNFEEQYIDNTHSVVKFDTKSEENTHESNSQGQIIIQDSPFHQTS